MTGTITGKMTDPIIDIKNARVFRKHVRVFDNLNLQIHAGQHTAILGPNGAGKTTLLKLLTRELYPVVRDESYIRLFGEELIDLWQLREKIGVVSHEFQNNYQAIATGLDVVISAFFGSVGIHGHNQVTEEQKQRALSHMEQLKILELKDKQFLMLSTGQQRRLLLARATIHTPQVLIFDEPTAGLDVGAAFALINDIRHYVQQGGTLILVTHHIDEIIPEISRVLLLQNGAIADDGDKPDILTSEKLSKLFDVKMTVSELNGYYKWAPNA
ncbi:putative ABC transporter ATP-binding protein YlmA [Thalassocella blandensis]|nr:putative ABC transporter ATP-binding protein YlmA [Thalassocella blandensis]